MTELQDLNIEEKFTKNFSNEYATVYSKDNLLVCVLEAEYVPIESFKDIFNKLMLLIKEGSYDTFIFDKRSLRTFHQPSMEWYYLDWKTEALEYGVHKHRKILPDLVWFVKAVEIAKKGLDDRLPPQVRERIEIKYCDSLNEAIEL